MISDLCRMSTEDSTKWVEVKEAVTSLNTVWGSLPNSAILADIRLQISSHSEMLRTMMRDTYRIPTQVIVVPEPERESESEPEPEPTT